VDAKRRSLSFNGRVTPGEGKTSVAWKIAIMIIHFSFT